MRILSDVSHKLHREAKKPIKKTRTIFIVSEPGLAQELSSSLDEEHMSVSLFDDYANFRASDAITHELSNFLLDSKKQGQDINIVNISGNMTCENKNTSFIDELITIYFNIFKCIHVDSGSELLSTRYILIHQEQCLLSGALEGVTFSLSKEYNRVQALSLSYNSQKDLLQFVVDKEYELLLNTYSSNSYFKLSNGAVFITGLHDVSARLDAIQSSKSTLSNNKTYLIAGAGKIAKQLASHLSVKYCANIIILGRREISPKEQYEFSDCGVSSYINVDISDYQQMKAAWEHCVAEFGSIDGIFYLAGILNDSLFVNKSIQDFRATLYPKVNCLLVLDLVTKDYKLDFFACFSSISGFVGNLGQTDYAAANGFMRRFCLSRNLLVDNDKRHGATFCIDWGLFKDGSMKIPYSQSAMHPLESKEAFGILEKILSNAIYYTAIYKGKTSVVSKLLLETDPKEFPNNSLRDTSDSLSRDDFSDNELRVVTSCRKIIKEIIVKHTKLKNLDNDQSIIEKGADSVSTINIVNDIETQLRKVNSNINIYKTLIFDYPSLNAITDYLMANYKSDVLGLLHQSNLLLSHVEKQGVTKESSLEQVTSNKFMQRNNSTDNTATVNDIAIIGVSVELPKARSLDEFWENLKNKINCIDVIPSQRWNWRKYYDPDISSQGGCYGRHGGFLDSLKHFDPLFFNISPTDAEQIDPQERFFLKHVYYALEDAGILSQDIPDTGVFASAMFGHYTLYNNKSSIIDSSFASVANRASYFFDFKGPSLTVDSMCSGSLTALHLACQSIRNNECHQAIVGGVNLMPHPIKYRLLSKGRFLSRSGKCQPFDIDADGYVPGEGVVVFMLRKLSDAVANNDQIYGVIKGSALNSGGKAAAFTVPNSKAQELVIQKALENASVNADDITYVECHGTGTSLGDPIEIRGLSSAYDKKTQKCDIGSVKSNIGHLESAAALAGMAKVLLQFKHNTLAPSLHCNETNPNLQLEKTIFNIVKESKPWLSDNKLRTAGVSSFGAGGSNGHVILQEYLTNQSHSERLPGYVITISAKSLNSLNQNIVAYKKYLESIKSLEGVDLYAIAYTSTCCRAHYQYRHGILFRTIEELGDKLERLYTSDFAPVETKESNSGIQVHLDRVKAGLNDSSEYLLSLEKVIEFYNQGYTIDWDKIYSHRCMTQLPQYCFDNIECWSNEYQESIDNDFSSDLEARQPHLNLDKEITLGNDIYFFESTWEIRELLDANNVDDIDLWIDSIENSGIDDIKSKLVALEPLKLENNSSIKIVIDFIALTSHESDSNFYQWIFELFGELVQTAFHMTILLACNNDPLSRSEVYPLSLKGFMKSLIKEYDNICVKFVLINSMADLDIGQFRNSLLIESNNINKVYSEVLYHEQVRYERVVKDNIKLKEISAGPKFRRNGSYIITGGFGGIGRIITQHIVEEYNADVIIIGSSNLNDDKRNFLDKLNQAANKVSYLQTNITEHSVLSETFTKINHKYDKINGILHLAGRTDDMLFARKKFSDFKSVFDIKAKGIQNLDDLTKTYKLDFFISFSSIASTWGNYGQVDYAAGNSFLDEYSSYRNKLVRQGLRKGATISINWPYWESGHMEISDQQVLTMRDSYGLKPLSSNQGVNCLKYLLERSNICSASIVPLHGDLNKITSFINAVFSSKKVVDSQQEIIVDNLNLEIKKLIKSIAKISVDKLSDNTPLGDFGFDSVSFHKLTTMIHEKFKVTLSPSSFFSINTIAKIEEHIIKNSQILHKRDPVESMDNVDKQGSNTKTTVSDSQDVNAQNKISNGNDKYAIIGIGGRFPGGRDLNEYWENLINERDCINHIDRWSNYDFYGGTIPDMECFDAAFFKLSARESMLMDPQHRLFLQAAYNTFLNAGYNPTSLRNVGVFAGVQFNDYQVLLQLWQKSNHPYAATGNAHTMLANRVSYMLDFHGPSQTIDTACSSSLIAINRGIESLKNNNCSYALCGGVSLLIDPVVSEAAKSMGVISEQNRCATFDESADGYVRGEGVGCVLIRKLDDAIADKDYIYAVIEGYSENHGGRAHSLTAPNPDAQKDLLLKSYSYRELAKQVSYIEAHGTGTNLGDPIEVESLTKAWKEMGVPINKNTIGLGSVKSNIGHLEPASGIASLIKVILSMKNKILPASINFKKLNPYIDIEKTPFYIVNKTKPWASKGLRVAGISSFGFGGSNAHIVIKEFDMDIVLNKQEVISDKKNNYLICLSAKTENSLRANLKELKKYVKGINLKHQLYSLDNISYTLNTGREHFDYRVAFVVGDHFELLGCINKALINHIPRVNPKNKQVMTEITGYHLSTQLQKLADKYTEGYLLPWDLIYKDSNQYKVPLPEYEFDTKPFWFNTAADSEMIKAVSNV